MAVEESLKAFGQWICGKCMTLHAFSRHCHHPNGLVSSITENDKLEDDVLSCYIVGILKRL